MIIIYATINKQGIVSSNNKRLNVSLDNIYLNDKIVVMDKEYYFENISDFENIKVVTISNEKLDTYFKVTNFNSLETLYKTDFNKNNELFIIGSDKLITKAVPLATKIILNVIDMPVDNPTKYLPEYDYHNWMIVNKTQSAPGVNTITMDRIYEYGSKKKKIKLKDKINYL